MHCAIYNLLPTVNYPAAWFWDDSKNEILRAINGGGHHRAKTMLAGVLVGGQVGLSEIPSNSSKV